ncbi:MAG: hypothetical protein PVH29_14625 [Candidatus Zixiibacteriota bacterium]
MGKRMLRLSAVLAAVAAWAALSCEDTPTDTEGAYKGPWKAYEVLRLPAPRAIDAVYMLSSTQGWAIARGPAFLHFDGLLWYVHSYGEPKGRDRELLDLSFSSPDDGWAAGYYYKSGDGTSAGGLVYHFDGNYWEDVSPPDIPPLYCIFALAPDDVWAGGSGGLYHYDGADWTRDDVYGGDIIALDFTSPDAGWAVRRWSTYLRWDGVAWEKYTPDEGGATVYDVYCPSATEAWSVGEDRPMAPLQTPLPSYRPSYPIYRWNDATAAWEPYRGFAGKDDDLQLTCVHFAAPDDGWAVGSTVLHYDGTGWKWVSQAPGYCAATCVFSAGGNEVWIGSADGTMYKYDPGTPE